MNTPSLRIERRQQQTLTPRLQQAVRLLQMSSLDFAQEVQNLIERNPFLESDEPTEEAGSTGLADPSDTVASEGTDRTGGDTAPTTDAEREGWGMSMLNPVRGGGEADGDLMDHIAASTTLRQHLHGQANVMPLTERDRMLVGIVIESLDDDGYCRIDLADLALLADLHPAVEECEMRIALKLVQAMDPCGVGARDVAECLLLQVQSIEQHGERELARAIIGEQLQRLAQGDVAGLARVLKRQPGEVASVVQRIRQMDPHPGWRFGAGEVRYITPDLIVRKVNGAWAVSLNPAVVPRVRVNQVYAELFHRHRSVQHSDLAAHLQEARWAVRNVKQRFATILSVAEAILRRQQHFLEFGPHAMKPLSLREIADEVGVHESTVSRVTNNKYIATPTGVLELKRFFSRALSTATGMGCSATAIRSVMQDIVAAESPATPLSDADIMRLLARQGLKVARRTVTKYRQLLQIPAVERRRIPCGTAPAGAQQH